MNHEEERRQDVNEWKMFQKDVVDIIRQHKDVDDDQIHHLIGLLSINCVGVRFKRDKKEGRPLYPLLSIACHSCVANARYAGTMNKKKISHTQVLFVPVNPDDFTVVLRAGRAILEGEEITINYILPIYGVPKSKLEIANEWYFDCK